MYIDDALFAQIEHDLTAANGLWATDRPDLFTPPLDQAPSIAFQINTTSLVDAMEKSKNVGKLELGYLALTNSAEGTPAFVDVARLEYVSPNPYNPATTDVHFSGGQLTVKETLEEIANKVRQLAVLVIA